MPIMYAYPNLGYGHNQQVMTVEQAQARMEELVKGFAEQLAKDSSFIINGKHQKNLVKIEVPTVKVTIKELPEQNVSIKSKRNTIKQWFAELDLAGIIAAIKLRKISDKNISWNRDTLYTYSVRRKTKLQKLIQAEYVSIAEDKVTLQVTPQGEAYLEDLIVNFPFEQTWEDRVWGAELKATVLSLIKENDAFYQRSIYEINHIPTVICLLLHRQFLSFDPVKISDEGIDYIAYRFKTVAEKPELKTIVEELLENHSNSGSLLCLINLLSPERQLELVLEFVSSDDFCKKVFAIESPLLPEEYLTDFLVDQDKYIAQKAKDNWNKRQK